jgi:hypothetical protein
MSPAYHVRHEAQSGPVGNNANRISAVDDERYGNPLNKHNTLTVPILEKTWLEFERGISSTFPINGYPGGPGREIRGLLVHLRTTQTYSTAAATSTREMMEGDIDNEVSAVQPVNKVLAR